jgi:hypothetical protein
VWKEVSGHVGKAGQLQSISGAQLQMWELGWRVGCAKEKISFNITETTLGDMPNKSLPIQAIQISFAIHILAPLADTAIRSELRSGFSHAGRSRSLPFTPPLTQTLRRYWR